MEVFLARIVMPRSRSSGLESITRSWTTWFSRKAPAWRSILSTSVVFPWSTCAMMAILRICIAWKYILAKGRDSSQPRRRARLPRARAVLSRQGRYPTPPPPRHTRCDERDSPRTTTPEVCMSEHGESPITDYPHGRGYGHDYMRGGEVFGGYGYAERDEYSKARGELTGEHSIEASAESTDGAESQGTQT